MPVLLAVLALGGCGGGTHRQTAPPAPPRLPHALAQAWAQQADRIAAALAAGDGCGAQRLATSLGGHVQQAAGAVPRRLLVPVQGAVADLAARISCTPPAKEHGKGHGRGKGKDEGGG